MKRDGHILIVDDDTSLAEALEGLFKSEGHTVYRAGNSHHALEFIDREPIALVLLDIRLGQENGLDILPQLKALRPDMTVFVMTAHGTVDTMVEAMRLGADHYITKPMDPPRLLSLIDKGLEVFALRQKVNRLEQKVHHYALGKFPPKGGIL